jgi:RHS repeat-associated protein
MRDKILMVNDNRVARIDKDYDGMIFVGNYYETRYYNNTIDPPPPITEGDNPVDSQPGTEPSPTPVKPVGDVSYYYAGSQRIAMRIGNETYFLFGDHLGSSILLVRGEGTVAEKAYYLPWGGTRGGETISSSAYAYTGQMREGDIYYYNARWPKVPEAKLKGFDPDIGRFMQADSIVPLQVQGTQAFDRYAYVNNNPLRYVDPGGDFAITTAILIGVGVGALAGYAGQVIHNLNNDMSFKEALTTDISAGWIVGGAVAGGALGGAGFAALAHFGIIQATTATTAVGSGLCADGDCGNEIRMLADSGLNTIDDVANSEIGQNLARAFTHNGTSQTVSIGSFDD